MVSPCLTTLFLENLKIKILKPLSGIQILDNLVTQQCKVIIPLPEIQKSIGLHPERRIFDSVLAFRDFEINEILKTQHEALVEWDFNLLEYAGYPLVIKAYAGKQVKTKCNKCGNGGHKGKDCKDFKNGNALNAKSQDTSLFFLSQ